MGWRPWGCWRWGLMLADDLYFFRSLFNNAPRLSVMCQSGLLLLMLLASHLEPKSVNLV
ncbi:hypothetical protein PF010_g24412 [Phytophthora fragariae]|uniref:Uncharacterized protein n=1 Tax=Phytophthora fragariae TaxID=53985 RepID=A0A6G0K390_9STRA|nr:hypothetical protein PF010_g24412 [Phytophthora fragariae]KAE9185235.1 hypothetical protein PF004_g23420 [Phytophthora fragariae]KAE9294856.1 hypothetical protein PF008_g24429 [Phytophthora fragariae]